MTVRAAGARIALFATVIVATLSPTLPARASVLHEVYHVPTLGGSSIRVEVYREDSYERVPVILTYSPYGNDTNRGLAKPIPNDSVGQRYVPRGYARAFADLLGTRGSSGCYDYGGNKEQQSGVDVVNFLAAQPWSNGKVAMTGVSYDGTTATMVAAAGDRVPGLAAIVPVAGVSSWYDYAYSQGARNFAGFGQPSLLDFQYGRMPPPDASTPTPVDMVVSRASECGAVEHNLHGTYDDTPDYDEFWRERDYVKDAGNFRVPTLIVHGYDDPNVKPNHAIELYQALKEDDPDTAAVEGPPFKMLFLSNDSHGHPQTGIFTELLDRFFEQTLQGIDHGLEDGPEVYSSGMAGNTELAYTTAPRWPFPGTHPLTLHLGRAETGGLLSPDPTTSAPTSYTDPGALSDVLAIVNPPTEAGWLYYRSPPLARDLRITGIPILDATLSVDRSRGQLHAILVDDNMAGARPAAARGAMNLRYRNGVTGSEDLPPNVPVGAKLLLQGRDFTFRAGHQIGLLVLSSNTSWTFPDVPGATVTMHHGANDLTSILTLPAQGPPGQAEDLFEETPPAGS